MNIHVKSGGPSRIDHPERDPNYRRAVEVGQENMKSMKFESEGQRRDYERAINANPNNVYGTPEFFPPVQIKMHLEGFGLKRTEDLTDEEREEKLREKMNGEYYIEELFCQTPTCEKVRPHWISRTQSFCQICGKIKDIRLA